MHVSNENSSRWMDDILNDQQSSLPDRGGVFKSLFAWRGESFFELSLSTMEVSDILIQIRH